MPRDCSFLRCGSTIRPPRAQEGDKRECTTIAARSQVDDCRPLDYMQRPAELLRGPLRVIPATRTMFVVVGELIRPRSRLSS
jgi:hypothetical protein